MDLRKEKELTNSVAGLRDSIGNSELEGKDGMLEDLREMESNWKGIKAKLSDLEKQRIGDEVVKVWIVELRDLAWEIEDLVGLYDYHVLAMQADQEEEEEEDFNSWDGWKADKVTPCKQELVISTPYPLEEDVDFGLWEPERWCSNTLLRAKADAKRIEVSFGYVGQEQNEVRLSKASASTRSLVKKMFRQQYPGRVFVRSVGHDCVKVTYCYKKDNHHIHIQKSLSLASSSSSRLKGKVPLAKASPSPPPPPVDPSFLKEISDSARKMNDRFYEIADRKEALDLLTNMKQASGTCYDIDDSSISYRQAIPSGSLPANRDKFVGRDEEMKEMVGMLVHSDADATAEVIAVVGMGGIGKTALCQHTYNHPRIKAHFDHKGWVYVGETFNVLSVINDILASFTKGDSNHSNQVSIAQELLMEKLEGKRFLLVMDDVWCENSQEWEPVLAPLLNNIPVRGGRSKILITTRNQAVARTASALRLIRLNCLSEKDGWCLFSKYANIGVNGPDSQELVHIGKGIVEKCKGLPLAIKVTGSLMKNKGDDVDGWREILNSDFSDLNEEEGGVGREILGPLYLSYLNLPPLLKACFKFFNFFDKANYHDLEQVEKLTDLWLAHNLIGDHKGKTSYKEQGRRIIHDFALRSFLDLESTETDRVQFRVHDLILDVAKYVSGNEICIKLNVTCSEDPDEDQAYTLPPGVKHLSIETEENLLRNFIPNDTLALRTLELRPVCKPNTNYVPFCIDLYANLRFLLGHGRCLGVYFPFKHLRVLCIRNMAWKVIPRSLYELYNLTKLRLVGCKKIKRVSNLIGNLKNLRYLSFKHCNGISSIPNSVSKLTSLEELYIHDCVNLKDLPTGITRLVNLHSLDVSSTQIMAMPLGLSNLKKLRHLPRYCLGFGKLHHLLNDLNGLKLEGGELGIWLGHGLEELRYGEAESGIKGRFHNMTIWFTTPFAQDITEFNRIVHCDADALNDEQILEHLRPRTFIRKSIICYYRGTRLPTWMGDPSFDRLVSFKLDYVKYCKTLSPIHKLPSLRELRIKKLYALKNLIPEDDSEVIASGNTNLRPCLQKTCFPKLEELRVSKCHNMEFLHTYQLTTLQELYITDCRKLKSIGFMHRDYPSSVMIRLSIERCPLVNLLAMYPLTALQTLSIESCENLKSFQFVEPSSSVEEIQLRDKYPSLLVSELSLKKCPAMEHLPIHQLTALQRLSVSDCEKLIMSIEFEDPSSPREDHHDKGSPSCLITKFTLSCFRVMEVLHLYQLSALQKLSIRDCEKLKSILFTDPSSSRREHRHRGNPSLSLLSELSLVRCDAMELLPIYPLTALYRLSI